MHQRARGTSAALVPRACIRDWSACSGFREGVRSFGVSLPQDGTERRVNENQQNLNYESLTRKITNGKCDLITENTNELFLLNYFFLIVIQTANIHHSKLKSLFKIMSQHFYIDDSGLDDQLMRLNRNLSEMLEFAYIHEDMVSTIEMFMVDWARIYLPDLCKELSLHDDLSISSIVDCSSEV